MPLPPPARFYRLAWGFYLALALAGVLWIGLREGQVPLALFVDSRRAGRSTWPSAPLPACCWSVSGGSAGAPSPPPASSRTSSPTCSGRSAPPTPRRSPSSPPSPRSCSSAARCRARSAGCRRPLLFALLHSGPGRALRLWTLFAAAAGLLFGALMLWRGNLLAPVAAHFLVNCINLRGLGRRFRDSGRLAGPAGKSRRRADPMCARDSRDVLARIDAEKETYLEELKDYIRIPSISTDPDYQADVRRAAEFLRGKMRGGGPHRRADRDRRPPAGLRRVDGRPGGRPDGALLRPLRRPAGRPGRALAQPALRADGRGRQAGGARRDRRQGPVLHPRQGGAGDARRARRAAGQRQVPGRGRGGGRRRGDREIRPRGRRQAPGGRLRGGLRHLALRARPAVADLRPQGPRLHGDQGHRPEPRPALRHLRRRGHQPAQRALPRSSPACATRRPAAS